MKATILTVGDEILIGQIIDTNAAWISEQLTSLGITVVERLTVADEHDPIWNGIAYCLSKSDIVLMTGGLGPTKDDITKLSIANYLGVGLSFHEDVYLRIKAIFEPRNIPLTDSHRQQCFLPDGVQLLTNSMGTAPGMLFEKDGKKIVSMPGVPYEMKAIMLEELLPLLSSSTERKIILHKTILTAGYGESVLADMIEDIVDAFPPHLSMAYLPSLGMVRLRVTARGEDALLLQQDLDQAIDTLKDRLGDMIFGYDKLTLPESIQKLCIDHKLTLSLAESCTGGFASHLITAVPGSSAYYLGSIISYSNDIKTGVLKVKKDTIANYGAVSHETVREMVAGVRAIMNTDLSIAISGIAGPTGGTKEKPVGMICIAVGGDENIETMTILGSKSRSKNIEYASNHALNMLRKYILKYKLD